MKLSNLLWENWQNWRAGGLDAAFIEEHIEEQDKELLLAWLDHAYNKLKETRPLLTLKTVVDIGTWCLYGTHSLDYYPSELRAHEYERTAIEFGILVEILIELSLTRSTLPEYP